MTVLTKEAIVSRLLKVSDPLSRLTISPLLDFQSQISGASIDLRLGTHFITHRRPNITHTVPEDPILSHKASNIEERLYIQIGEKLVLHPRQFVIGSTLEYLGMPFDLMGYVNGKSSWGRLGLVVATAFGIHPGFRGVLALELVNLGEVPISLQTGRTIAQLFLHDAEKQNPETSDKSGYMASNRPLGARIKPDPIMESLKNYDGLSK